MRRSKSWSITVLYIVDNVKGLEQRCSKMVLEINRLLEFVKLKDKALVKSRAMWEAAHIDVTRIASICEVPAVAIMKSGLYEAGITKSEVFKSDTFKKFIKATMAYTKWIKESSKTVLETLGSVRRRIDEAGPRPVPTFDSPVKPLVSLPSPVGTPRTDAGSSIQPLLREKGKEW